MESLKWNTITLKNCMRKDKKKMIFYNKEGFIMKNFKEWIAAAGVRALKTVA